MKKKLIAAIAGAAVIATAIWGMRSTSVASAKDLMAGLKPNTVSIQEDLTEYNAEAADFGVRLLQNSMQEENCLVSPLSVLYALSMTANGAKGETLAQMETVLGLSVDELNRYLYSYMESLSANEKYKLRLANSIWFTDAPTFQVEKAFLQTNADYYGADILERSFDNGAAEEINQWVKKETDGMIKEILKEVPEDAVMYLVNALAFEAEWQEVYKENQVHDAIFTTEDDTQQKVEMMYSRENYYLEDAFAKGFVKYYKDCDYAFVALLPNEEVSVKDYVAGLTGEHILELLQGMTTPVVQAAIPKFEVEYEAQLQDVLAQMGMPLAFDEENADFSGLGRDTREGANLFINRVLHKTYISVAEQGTKAGAATVVEIMTNGATAPSAEEIKTVYLDRPFVYMLVDMENGLPFFLGTQLEVK